MGKFTPATLLGALIARGRILSSSPWRWEMRLKGVELLGKVELQGRPLVSVAPGARIVLSDRVRIHSAVRANPLGLAQPCVLRALVPGAQLLVGPSAGMSGTVLCAAASIEIGEQTIFGAGAMVLDTDMHSPAGEWGWEVDYRSSAKPIKIGRGVFIGARAIILKGVTIGDRAIVGAGAVVTRDVPAYHIAAGNPARMSPYQRPASPPKG